MERVTPQNLVFLSTDDDRRRLHVGTVCRFAGPPPPLTHLTERVEAALSLVPRARQRIQEVPLRLARPVWIDDVAFDISNHVRSRSLAPRGSMADLESVVGELMATPLDRDRPLWAMWLVTGLHDDEWALVTISHQVMVDGIAGTPLLAVLLDLSAEPRTLPTMAWEPREEPSDLRMVGDALSDLAVDPAEVGRVVQSGLRVQGAALRWAADRIGSGSLADPDATGLTGPIGTGRCWRGAVVDLEPVRQVRTTHGASVNDVVLAVISGAFRRLLISRGAIDAVEAIRIAVPLSVGDGAKYENDLSIASYDLPVRMDDPVDRLDRIAEQSAALADQGIAADVLRGLAGNPSARLLAMGSRLAAMAVRHQSSYHSLVVHVPGPTSARFLIGHRMLAQYPLVPLVDGIRVAVGALSVGDRIHVGVTGDLEHSDDLTVLVDALPSELELLATAPA